MLVHNIMQVAHSPDDVLRNRATAVHYWRRRAVELLPRSDSELRSVPDCLSRRLLRGCLDSQALSADRLGSFFHIAL
jgi:hypothetical protein